MYWRYIGDVLEIYWRCIGDMIGAKIRKIFDLKKVRWSDPPDFML
jgi:hypothetical protein